MAKLRRLPRTLLTYVVGFLATLVAAPTVIVASWFRRRSPVIEKTARAWSRAWLWAGGVDLKVMGSENVVPGRSYVVVANHVSTFDIMACFLAVPVPIRFLAKKELFRIPLLARAMRAIGIVEVDRTGRAAVHEQINTQAKELIASGRSLIIYPEGTRPRDGRLAPFKKGAFTIAVATGLPVLPVAIRGSFAAWPPGTPWVRGGPIEVLVGQPIETKGMTQSDTGRLRDSAHETIAGRLVVDTGQIGAAPNDHTQDGTR